MRCRGQKPNFAHVHDANDQELKALEDFVIMKEKCIMKLMYVKRNLRAIENTKWLMQYLKEFPRKDKLKPWSRSQFWLGTREVNANPSMERHGSAVEESQPLQSNASTLETGSTVLDHLPPILQRGYLDHDEENHRIQPLSQPKDNEHIPKRFHLLQM